MVLETVQLELDIGNVQYDTLTQKQNPSIVEKFCRAFYLVLAAVGLLLFDFS